MISFVRRIVARLFGAGSDDNGENGDARSLNADDGNGVDGTGEPILDEVYGQPSAAREVEKIREQARELEDDRDRK